MNSASAPTLFMKPELSATIPVSAATCAQGRSPTCISRRATLSTTPALSRPRLSTSTAATEITAGCPRPANTSSGGTTPVSAQASNAARATRS